MACLALLLPCLATGCGTDKPQSAQAPKTTESLTTPKPAEPQPPAKTEDFQDSLNKASQLLAQKKTQEAWDAVKRLSLVRPQDPDLIYLSALVLAAKADLPAALHLAAVPGRAGARRRGCAAPAQVACRGLPEVAGQ